jgi:phosphoenolpyruvate-protein kinase (PTS system EI component)
MKKYVLANIKIPILVDENGIFDLLNEYTQTEITHLNNLPTIDEEDNLYKKIMEFLKDEVNRADSSKDNLEEPVQKIKIKDDIVEDEEDEEEAEKEADEDKKEAELSCNATVEQVITICANNIKMRKHSDNMTFKNIKSIIKEKTAKGAKSYTRKTYF